MCGIVAYIGPNNAIPILFEGLQRLEYRGYDSAGVAVTGRSALKMHKCAGRVDELVESAPEAPARQCGHRAHPVGNAWPADRCQCPSPPGCVQVCGRGAQRGHRERHGAAGHDPGRCGIHLGDRQ